MQIGFIRHLPAAQDHTMHRIYTFILIAATLAVPAPAQEPPAQGQVALSAPVELRALTPLGVATVSAGRGDKVSILASEGDRFRVALGPFAAWVPAGAVAQSSPTPSPAPAPRVATPTPAMQAPLPLWAQLWDSLSHVPSSVALGTAAVLAIITALGLLLGRFRRLEMSMRKLQENQQQVRPQYSSQDQSPQPAGIAVPCPHCKQTLPLSSLRVGRGTCPACGGPFLCE